MAEEIRFVNRGQYRVEEGSQASGGSREPAHAFASAACVWGCCSSPVPFALQGTRHLSTWLPQILSIPSGQWCSVPGAARTGSGGIVCPSKASRTCCQSRFAICGNCRNEAPFCRAYRAKGSCTHGVSGGSQSSWAQGVRGTRSYTSLKVSTSLNSCRGPLQSHPGPAHDPVPHSHLSLPDRQNLLGGREDSGQRETAETQTWRPSDTMTAPRCSHACS